MRLKMILEVLTRKFIIKGHIRKYEIDNFWSKIGIDSFCHRARLIFMYFIVYNNSYSIINYYLIYKCQLVIKHIPFCLNIFMIIYILYNEIFTSSNKNRFIKQHEIYIYTLFLNSIMKECFILGYLV